MRFGRILGLVASLVVGAAVLTDSGLAWAQLRTLPANAKRAYLNGYQNPFVIFGNAQLRLAPGAVIYDRNNRTIVPVALPASADVVYTTDISGAVTRIYLLTPQESLRLDQVRR